MTGDFSAQVTRDADTGSALWEANVYPATKPSFSRGTATLNVIALGYVEAVGDPCGPTIYGCYYQDSMDGTRIYYHFAYSFAAGSYGPIAII